MELNNKNTWTQGRHYTLGPVEEWEARGGIALEEIPNVDDEVISAANHHCSDVLDLSTNGWE